MAKDLIAALKVIEAAETDIRENVIPTFEQRAIAVIEQAIADLETIKAEAQTAIDAVGLGSRAPGLPESLINGSNPLFLGPLGHAIANKRAAEMYQAGTPVNGVVIPQLQVVS